MIIIQAVLMKALIYPHFLSLISRKIEALRLNYTNSFKNCCFIFLYIIVIFIVDFEISNRIWIVQN